MNIFFRLDCNLAALRLDCPDADGKQLLHHSTTNFSKFVLIVHLFDSCHAPHLKQFSTSPVLKAQPCFFQARFHP